MTNKPIDKIVLAIVLVLLVCVAVLNLFQPERPTVSQTENRNLAAMPEFSVSTLLSGEYFAGISDFISDTFLARDTLVSISQKIDSLKSFTLLYDREGISVIVDPNAGQTEPTVELTLPTLPPLPTLPTVSQETEPPTEATEETVDPEETIPVEPIVLSENSATFTAGATHMLVATVGEGFENLQWEVTGDSGVAITDNGDGTVTVKSDGAGSATVTATVSRGGETYSAQCEITVNAAAIEVPEKKPVDFLPNGLFIYDGAAHSQSYFNEKYAPAYARLYDLYAQSFPESRMSVVIAPLSTITIKDPSVTAHISDQGSILDQLEAEIIGDVNFVNLKNVYLRYADEYLYFKSDHHWTHRGAYYAYSEFAKSVGMIPTPIDAFEVKILSSYYIGSMYNYTGDPRVAYFKDTVEAYVPTKACTMNVFYRNGTQAVKDNCIMLDYTNYVAFLSGDNPYTVINVPENPQDKNILVIKDSFGNAFVTYLVENYGNIVVIDPRYGDMNIFDFYEDYKFTDIVFMVNSSSANTSAWYDYLARQLY